MFRPRPKAQTQQSESSDPLSQHEGVPDMSTSSSPDAGPSASPATSDAAGGGRTGMIAQIFEDK